MPHKNCVYCAVCANKEKIKEIKSVSVALQQRTQRQRLVFKQTFSAKLLSSQTLPLLTVTVFTSVKHRPAGFSQQMSTSLPAVTALRDLEKERIPSRYPAIGSSHSPKTVFKVNFRYFKRVTQSCSWHTLVTVLIYRVTEML